MTEGTLVDSNVLLDLITEDAEWVDWSGEQLAIALDQGPVLINQVIFSEVSLGFSTIEALARFLENPPASDVSCLDLVRDLVGIARGPGDLASNKKHLRGYGR